MALFGPNRKRPDIPLSRRALAAPDPLDRAMRYLKPIVLSCLASLAQAEIAGVPPAQACNYLAGTGLPTTTYRQQADGSYRCASPHIDIGTVPGMAGRLNNIAYAAGGTAQAIATLQLTIDVDNPDQAAAIHRRLKDVANILARKLGQELPDVIQAAIGAGSAATAAIGKQHVAVARSDRAAGGYAVTVTIE
jgi:hypothetical protein